MYYQSNSAKISFLNGGLLFKNFHGMDNAELIQIKQIFIGLSGNQR